MKIKSIISLFILAGMFSCKKKIEAQPVQPPPDPVVRKFTFDLFDETGAQISGDDGNTFFITMSKGNSVMYSIRTKTPDFSITDFKNGTYAITIKDSLNHFGFTRDSLMVDDDKYNTGTNRYWNISCSWKQCNVAGLGSIQKKPSFTITQVTVRDTVTQNNGSGIYMTAEVSANIKKGAIAFFWYKNRNISSDTAFNYGLLYSSAYTHEVSGQNRIAYDLFIDGVFNHGPYFQFGDSIYFALYPASYNFAALGDFLSVKKNGDRLCTSLGNQKIVIAHKLH